MIKLIKKIFIYSEDPSKHAKADAGFTLVEILVAIFLLSIAITATTSILTFNARSATTISNNFVASGLAQEGIEVVRNIRDRDWFLGNSFGASLPDGTYRLIYNSTTLTPIINGNNPNFKKNASGSAILFNYSLGNQSIFKRSIDISTVVAGVEKRVVVNVTWPDRGGITKSVSAEDHLFNWK